eukprot:TRINITY_DN6649_c0_g1_i1.p1 TRINITY_DN6649_c0_g1~~TRINITY_DN6649_c0_g1_i1.p1  ORF type:complete len:297 (-),score=75.40 TRINITY_DN6649_c0_g1_i1:52-942(-)
MMEIYIAGFCIFSLLLISNLFFLVRQLFFLGVAKNFVVLIFNILLFIFTSLRLIWLSFYFDCETNQEVNVIIWTDCFAQLTFLSIFGLIIARWAEKCNNSLTEGETLSFKIAAILTSFILGIWIIEIIFVVFALDSCKDQKVSCTSTGYYSSTCSHVFQSDIILTISVTAFNFIIAFGFIFWGRKRWKLVESGNALDDYQKKEITQIFVMTFIYVCCFLSRSITSIIYLTTKKSIEENEIIFMFFNYYVPELIPAFIQLFALNVKISNEAEKTNLLDELYQETNEELKQVKRRLYS